VGGTGTTTDLFSNVMDGMASALPHPRAINPATSNEISFFIMNSSLSFFGFHYEYERAVQILSSKLKTFFIWQI
jgi:hypothetical protein